MIEGSVERWKAYLVDRMWHQFTPLTTVFALWGVFTAVVCDEMWRRRSSSSSSSTSHFGTTALLIAWLFYLSVWNGVFSNLPLSSSPMGYEVHARFWIQPNMIVAIFVSISVDRFISAVLPVSPPSSSSSSMLLQYLPKERAASYLGRVFLLLVFVGGMIHNRRDPSSPLFSYDEESSSSSVGGWIFHDYATALLDVIPSDSILLSHNDLNWNTVRYLQTCEEKRSSHDGNNDDDGVIHLSIQLLPYPWFVRRQPPTQRLDDVKKKKGAVVFPPILPGVSTDRHSEGNAVLITRFLEASSSRATVLLLLLLLVLLPMAASTSISMLLQNRTSGMVDSTETDSYSSPGVSSFGSYRCETSWRGPLRRRRRQT